MSIEGFSDYEEQDRFIRSITPKIINLSIKSSSSIHYAAYLY
tara:strand:+ start:339 stop:464 length:126 start_codon:yes stop_codon:yes gene_type:complete